MQSLAERFFTKKLNVMETDKQPTQMIVDQIDLLRSEERKLRKFVNHNKEAQNTVDMHLQEIKKKKKRLYRLCEIMGIDRKEEKEDASLHQRRFPQPTGRFGSALISWHSNNL